MECTRTHPDQSATRQVYSKVVVRMFVVRESRVWLYNFIMPVTVITFLVFGVFAIPHNDVGDRMAVVAEPQTNC